MEPEYKKGVSAPLFDSREAGRDGTTTMNCADDAETQLLAASGMPTKMGQLHPRQMQKLTAQRLPGWQPNAHPTNHAAAHARTHA